MTEFGRKIETFSIAADEVGSLQYVFSWLRLAAGICRKMKKDDEGTSLVAANM